MKKEEQKNFIRYLEELRGQLKIVKDVYDPEVVVENQQKKFSFILKEVKKYAEENQIKAVHLVHVYPSVSCEHYNDYYFLYYKNYVYMIENKEKYNNKSLGYFLTFTGDVSKLVDDINSDKNYIYPLFKKSDGKIIRESLDTGFSSQLSGKIKIIDLEKLLKYAARKNLEEQFNNINESIIELVTNGVNIENIISEINKYLENVKGNDKDKVKVIQNV